MPKYVEVNGARAFCTFSHNGVDYRYTFSRIFDKYEDDDYFGYYPTKNKRMREISRVYLAYGHPKYPEPEFENDYTKLSFNTTLIMSKSVDGDIEIIKQYPYIGSDLVKITLHEKEEK